MGKPSRARAHRLHAVLVWVLRHLAGLKGISARVRRLRTLAATATPPALASAPPPPGSPTVQAASSPGASKPPPALPHEAPSAYHAAAGAAMFGALLFLAGARPAALPAVFLLFAATALPWRVYHYTRVQPRNRVYLLDFCYAVAAATTAFLCLPARLQHPGLEAAVYALADGPVSAALVAWQCAWVFHSPDHTVRWGAGLQSRSSAEAWHLLHVRCPPQRSLPSCVHPSPLPLPPRLPLVAACCSTSCPAWPWRRTTTCRFTPRRRRRRRCRAPVTARCGCWARRWPST